MTLFAPALLFVETRNHLATIARKAKLPVADVSRMMTLLHRQLHCVPLSSYERFMPRAERILKEHPKDTHYVALSMRMRLPLWTYEARLHKRVRTIDTATLRQKLANLSREKNC